MLDNKMQGNHLNIMSINHLHHIMTLDQEHMGRSSQEKTCPPSIKQEGILSNKSSILAIESKEAL